ncbi:MAG: hypothetical protein ABL919_14375 [Methylococcales bacterium]
MNEDEARSHVCNIINNSCSHSSSSTESIPARLIEEIVDELLPIWETSPEVAGPPGRIGALLPFNYVIPDQDLKLVDTGFSVLTAVAGAGYFLPQLGFDPTKGLAATITGTMVVLLRLLHNLKLSVHLESRDYAIMTLLTHVRQDGLSKQALLEGIHISFPDMTNEELEQRLAALTACATLRGTKTALVWKDEQEHWHTNGV